ncbi:hypothetical protein KKF34_01705 [Myxococcota bacterium]|nr:hypothetical protein [Myxococcota bacterium]MBU1382455.1 hypothetical protein [Myxococcota bacterium]MBU1495574.1 hypothetical protein [Myxococcota bacterium]
MKNNDYLDDLIKLSLKNREPSRKPLSRDQILKLADSDAVLPDDIEDGVREFIQTIRDFRNSSIPRSPSFVDFIFAGVAGFMDDLRSSFSMVSAGATVRNTSGNGKITGCTAKGTHVSLTFSPGEVRNVGLKWDDNPPSRVTLKVNGRIGEIHSVVNQTVDLSFKSGTPVSVEFNRSGQTEVIHIL